MTVLSGGGEIALSHVSSSNSQRQKPFEGWPKAQQIRNLPAAVKRNKTFEIFERRHHEKRIETT